MEREIKFRGKDKSTDAWVCGYFCGNDIIPISNYHAASCGYMEEQPCFECVENSIFQFTGLKDDEGNEIYEGDILDAQSLDISTMGEHINGEVSFEDGAFYVKYKGFSCPLTLVALNNIVKIIGNIFDNPELLETEDK